MNTKIDWKRKLTSRKFWLAVVGLVSGIVLALKGDAELAETISGVIMAAASVIAYIVGEGLADSAAAGNGSGAVFAPVAMSDTTHTPVISYEDITNLLDDEDEDEEDDEEEEEEDYLDYDDEEDNR